jgi:hypothetical protein
MKLFHTEVISHGSSRASRYHWTVYPGGGKTPPAAELKENRMRNATGRKRKAYVRVA